MTNPDVTPTPHDKVTMTPEELETAAETARAAGQATIEVDPEAILDMIAQQPWLALRAFQADISQTADDSGFWASDHWANDHSFGDLVAMMHAKLAGATQAFASANDATAVWRGRSGRPLGVPAELASLVLLVFQVADHLQMPLFEEMVAISDWDRNDLRGAHALRPPTH